MPESCLLYYITDRAAFPGSESTRRQRLLEKIAEAAAAGINYIQLREKDLTTRELQSLAEDAMQTIRNYAIPEVGSQKPKTALLINSRTDVALATKAAGVHLPSDDINPKVVRGIWPRGAGTPARELYPQQPIISISCHSPEEVTKAAADGATLALFAPIFEKKDVPNIRPQGLVALAQAAKSKIPVMALGGITLENATSCLQAGAAGIAAIRLFQENKISAVVRSLKN